MTSLLQHGCKSLYQSALIDQMRKAQNQTQVKHALSSSTMSRSFTQKLLDMSVKKQLKAEQESKALKEKMRVMELKEEKVQKYLDYQLHYLSKAYQQVIDQNLLDHEQANRSRSKRLNDLSI